MRNASASWSEREANTWGPRLKQHPSIQARAPLGSGISQKHSKKRRTLGSLASYPLAQHQLVKFQSRGLGLRRRGRRRYRADAAVRPGAGQQAAMNKSLAQINKSTRGEPCAEAGRYFFTRLKYFKSGGG